MNQTKITTGKSLRDLLTKVINESISTRRILKEEDLDLFSDDAGSGEEDESADDEDVDFDSGESDSEDDDTSALKGEVKTEDIIEKLNAIRAGKSLKDKDIASNMQKYVKSLEQPERVALFAFLKAISQIVTAEVPAEDATDPAKPPANVQMKKSTDKKVIKIKPTIVAAKERPEGKTKSKPEGEDTSGPAPIKPKK